MADPVMVLLVCYAVFALVVVVVGVQLLVAHHRAVVAVRRALRRDLDRHP